GAQGTQRTISTVLTFVYLKFSSITIPVCAVGEMTKSQFLIIWTDKQIVFIIVFPIGRVKGVLLIFLFLFLTVLVVCNQWNTFPNFHDVFIILFTSITRVRNNIPRKLKILIFNLIQKRNQCTCICRIRKDIISKCVLPFSRKLYIITRLQLAISHMIVFHSHKRSVMIRLRVTVALSEDFHILLIFLFACQKVFESLAVLFWFFTLRAELFAFASDFIRFDFFIEPFHLIV